MTASTDPTQHPHFGRLIVRLHPHSAAVHRVTGWFLFFLSAGAGVACLTIPELTLRLVGVVLILGPVLIAFKSVKGRAVGLDVFERGLRVNSRESTDVSFDEIDGLKCQTTHVFVNGGHNHTVGSITFVRVRKPPIGVGLNVRRGDEGFAMARDVVARLLAERAYAALAERGQVPWVPGVSLRRDVLLLENQFVNGKAMAHPVKIAPTLRVVMGKGKCALFERERDEAPIVTLECGEQGFFPGLLLFMRLVSEQGRGPG